MQQLQAAVALHNQGELDQAEAIYRGVLSVDADNFYALNFCGCICRERKRFEEGIDLLSKASSLQPGNPDAVYNLGNVFKDAERWDEAISCYEKTLGLRAEYPEALNNLGICLNKVERFEHSEIVLRRAVSLQPGFAGAWLNLGNTLKEQDKFEEAIASYRKAIEAKPDFADADLNLGNALKEEGEVEAAADAFAEHYRLKPIAQSLSFVPTVAPQSLNTAYELKVPESAEFIPSYVSHAIPFGMHLMYVHIPKAGGIRFANPIFGCIRETLLEGGWEKYSDLVASAFGRNEVSVMASHRIDSDPMRDGIVAAFSSYDLPALDFSFLTPHGVSSRELFQGMRDQFDVQPKRLATWRDPRKRMRSALDYLWRTSEGDLDLVEKKIRERDPFLDNAIYRGCFSDFSPQMLPDEQRDVQVDHLIDIGDFSVMNQIMSSFLSRCRLPNIIVNKRVNVTSTDKKMDAGLADSLMAQCVEAGFITLDGAPVIEQMVSSGLPAEFDLHVDPSSASLHPLTFVLNAVTDIKTVGDSWLLPTEALMADQGQEFLKKTFAQ